MLGRGPAEAAGSFLAWVRWVDRSSWQLRTGGRRGELGRRGGPSL